MSMMDEYKALQKNKKKSILEEHIEKNGASGLNEAYVQYATSPDRAEIDARNRAARTVSTPAAPSAETPKKTGRRIMSPGGTFLGGFSFAGDRQKTAKELADEQAQQEAYVKEYRRLAGLDLDDYRAEVEQAGKKAQESKEPYNIHAFGAYNPQKSEAERTYAAMKADLNKAESIQYDIKGREALDNLTEDQTAALEVLTDTAGVPAASAHTAAERKQAARDTLLASGFTEDELSQLVNYYRNIPKREKNAERYAKVQEMARNEGEKSPVGGTLLSVPANLLSGVGAIDAALRKLADPNTPTDYNAPAMLPYAYASGVRGEVTKNLQYDHGEGAAFLYGVGTSILDSTATVALAALGVPPAAASATLGGAAATDAMTAAHERGLDDSHSVATGVAAGVLESFFEKVSLESLISMKLPSGTMKQKLAGMLKNTAIQAGIEGSEEMFTDIGNLVADRIINGGMADVEQRIAVYMAGGMSYPEARQKVAGETIRDIAVDFGAGALAGGLMGGGNMAMQTAARSRYENAVQQVRQRSGVTGAYQASEDGRTTYNGEEAKIRSVVKDGKVQLESGETVDPGEVRFKDQETADLYEGAIRTAENAGAAQVFVDSYTGGDVSRYLLGMRQAYEAGRTGIPAEEMTRGTFADDLSERQRSAAYEQGRLATEAEFPVMGDMGLGEAGSKAWATAQKANTTLSRGKVQAGFTALYQAGLRREKAGSVKSAAASALPASIQTAAYEAGLSDGAASLAREKAGVTFASSAGSESGLVDSEHARKLSQEKPGTAALLGMLGKEMGLRVEIVPTIRDGKANGQFIASRNLIQLAADANNALEFVAAHEVTHRMQELAPEEYRTYRDRAMAYAAQTYGEEGAAAIVERYRADAEEAGVKLTQEEAMDEIAADFTQNMMEDGKLFEDFARENRKEARTLLDALKAFIEKVKSLFRSKAAQDAAAREAYGTDMATLEECAALWQKAYDAAGKQAQRVRVSDAVQQGDTLQYDDAVYSLRVTDKDTLDFLNGQKTIKTYKTMQIVDGKLYPPMAARVDGKYEDASELGKWEMAVERPDLVKDGKFKLDKGKGQGSLTAAYNPYMHSSNLVINDQFSGAYTRNNLVTVECEVPVSEMTSGYHAEGAKDGVGWHSWHTGTVAGQIRRASGTERKVFLSRWIKPVRILPDAEVAGMYKDLLGDTGIAVPDNVVTPSLLKELRKAGVAISESGRVKTKTAAHEGDGDGRYQLKNFSEQAVSTALYDALSEKATRQNQLIPVSVMPRYISEKLGISGDIYIQRDHAYENMVSKEQAIQDGRPTQRKGEDVHFHDLGVEKMTRAIMSINEPTMTIATKTKDGNPAVIMMLPEYGNNDAPLYAVLSFYSRKTISPENREMRPHVILTIAERNFFEDGGRYGWADVIKRAINEGTVIDFNKKERSSLSEVAQSVGLGDITDASLKKNLAQFQKEVKRFRESNNIRYQLKSATELAQEVKELKKYAAYRARGTSDRDILTTTAESAAQTQWERKRLAEYKDAVERLAGYEKRLAENRAKAEELSFAGERKNARELAQLRDEITKDTNRVAVVEDQLKTLAETSSLKTLLSREKTAIRQQESAYLSKVETLLGGYRDLYGTMKPGERAARDIQLPKKSGENEKISQTVRTVLEAKATPEEMVPDIETLAMEGKFSYEAYSDKAAIADADGEIRHVGWAQALNDWNSAMKSGSVSKANTAMGWALYNNAANSGDTASALTILEKMVQHQRSAAQALQATRILKSLSPETQLYQAQRSVENLQAELNEALGDGKAPELKIDPALAEKFMQATGQEERDAVLHNIYRDIGRQMPSRFIDKWNAWRYLAMLGNARTHVRNVVGNAGFVPVVAAKNAVATGIEKAVYRLSGGKMARTKEFVSGKEGKALLAAAAQDFARVKDTAMGGGKYSEFSNANPYIEEGRVIFQSKIPGLKQVSKGLEFARKKNSQLLDAEDAIFSKPHYAYAMAQYCKANGITAEMIAKGGDKVVKAREYAIKEAQKATYRDTNAFSQAISELGRAGRRSSNWAKRLVSTTLEGILPFRKTPANILVRGVEYSPIGLMSGIKQALFDVRTGKKTAAEAIDAISAGLTGTGLMCLGLFMAAQCLVRGHGDDDKDKNEFASLTGHQNYALELPDGTSITLDWLAPECLPFFVGVNLWELTESGEESPTLADMLGAVAQVTEPLLEMSCLQSLNEVFEAVGYAQNNDMPGMVKALASAVTGYVTQGLPTLLGQAERTGENVRYTTYTDKNSALPLDVQYALGRASARIPIWDYSQIPYIDAWGRKEETGNFGQRLLNNFLNPAYTSRVEESAMEQELLRLYEETGDGGILPSRAGKSITADHEKLDLTGEQYVKYAENRGSEAYRLMTALTQSSAYRSMSDEEKKHAVKDIYDYANQIAKTTVSSFKPDTWVSEAKASGGVLDKVVERAVYQGYSSASVAKYKEYGGSVSEDTFFTTWKAVHSMTGEDYDGDGESDPYSKIDKQLEYINGLNLTSEEKRRLAIANGMKESTVDKRAPWR